MKKYLVLVGVALASLAGAAYAQGGGPSQPTNPPTCSWPSWQNCGDTQGDMVNMTCATARAFIQQNPGAYLMTEDGSQLGPIMTQANCSGDEQVELYNVRTTDSMACTVGEYCRPYTGR